MNNDFINKLNEIRQRIPELIKRLPGIAKVEGLNFIHDNFDKEGFEDKPGSAKKWEKRKQETGKGKKKRQGRQILIDKGKLRRSWDSETKATNTTVEFTSSMPYAEAHNDGLQAGRPPGFMMPERKMIGDSEALNKRIEDKFDRMVDSVFK
jgi:phage gpG-like protein